MILVISRTVRVTLGITPIAVSVIVLLLNTKIASPLALCEKKNINISVLNLKLFMFLKI